MTLIVKLAVTAVLATMLARFRIFRRILLTERRDWPERLVFAAGFGIPLTAGVAARLLLHYDAADLTLSGSFLTGLIAGPYSGALVGAASAFRRSSTANGARCPSRSAAASPAAACARSVRRKKSGSSRRSSSPGSTSPRGGRSAAVTLDWQVVLVTAPILLELLRQTIGSQFPAAPSSCSQPTDAAGSTLLVPLATVLGRRDSDQDLEQRAHRASAGRAGAAADGGARRRARQSDQSALPVQHADVDLVADPIAARNGARADRQAVGPAAPAAAQPGALRDAARGAGRRRRVSRHRARAVRPEPRQSTSSIDETQPRHRRAEHDPAAARRELDQARPRPQGRRRPHHDPVARDRPATS